MVAYNFMAKFAGDVAAGRKNFTIRADRERHAKPGEKVQLYTGMRTTNCRKLIDPDPICEKVEPIRIYKVHNELCRIRLDNTLLTLRQAEKLMKQHGLTNNDVSISEINESTVKAKTKFNPPRWQMHIAYTVRTAFQCSCFFNSSYNEETTWTFIGKEPAAEIASYAFNVLNRKCANARKDYYNSNKRFKRANRIRRADLFAEFWVKAIHEEVEKFTQRCPKTEEIINKYIKKYHQNLVDAKPGNTSMSFTDSRDVGAILDGLSKGSEVSIHHAVNGQEQGLIGN